MIAKIVLFCIFIYMSFSTHATNVYYGCVNKIPIYKIFGTYTDSIYLKNYSICTDDFLIQNLDSNYMYIMPLRKKSGEIFILKGEIKFSIRLKILNYHPKIKVNDLVRRNNSAMLNNKFISISLYEQDSSIIDNDFKIISYTLSLKDKHYKEKKFKYPYINEGVVNEQINKSIYYNTKLIFSDILVVNKYGKTFKIKKYLFTNDQI